MQSKEYSMEVGGRTLTATFTNLADQANGSVLVRYGETVVLVTAVMGGQRDGLDYFPLTVDYEEKFYAAGKILGSRFMRREGKPTDEAVLGGRIVDRTIRPLFDQRIRNEVQVVITILSIDDNNDPDVPGVIGASLALGTSNIPWNGPASAVRVGLNGEFKINPTYGEREEAQLDLLVCGKDGRVNMIESEAKEINEDKMNEALKLAVDEIEKIQTWQKKIIAEIGQEKKVFDFAPTSEDLLKLFAEVVAPKLEAAVFTGAGKAGIHDLQTEWFARVKTDLPDTNPNEAADLFEQKVDEIIHEKAIKEEKRADGRKLDEVRQLFAQAGGLSPIVHGTGIFFRGGTHILTVLTLGGPKEAQIVEGMEIRTKRYFMHHYNFPPFSTGETGRLGNTNRRSIGHGALAEKSLRAIIPARETFPYSIRLVSEALASNGSTSMGSVCASTLALMDGGVPIKAPVAGIAMGLMSGADGQYKILTDIQGPEDHYGDMDFKVAGTKDGVTGIQLDIKVDSIPLPILAEALTKARTARLHILETITGAISEPRKTLKPSAPAIVMITIPTEKIGAVIGPGGKVIQKIQAENEVEIEIEDSGAVTITGKQPGVEATKKIIEEMTHEYRAGERFTGTVTRLMDFGAFVKIGHEAEGLVHISEIAPFRVGRVGEAFQEGDQVPVVVKEIDEKGRINLSIKEADPEWASRKGLTPAPADQMGYNNGQYGQNERRSQNGGPGRGGRFDSRHSGPRHGR